MRRTCIPLPRTTENTLKLQMCQMIKNVNSAKSCLKSACRVYLGFLALGVLEVEEGHVL